MTTTSKKEFAIQWESAWNSHNIDKIMSHYADDIMIVSPIAERLLGNAKVEGFKAVKNYFTKGLQKYPSLQFTVLDILYAKQSIILYYVNQDGIKVGEFMQFNDTGKIAIMYAHYNK